MKVHLPLYLFLILLLRLEDSPAQTPQIVFNVVEEPGEVTLGKINGITQDSEGFMWFADQGKNCVTRYDGYTMVRFRHDPLNPHSLGGTFPEAIVADSAGGIWIGLLGQGLDRYDPKTGVFTHYRHANDPNSLSSDSITALLIDHRGVLWVGNYGGLDRFDQKTGKFKRFTHKVNDSTTLSSTRIRALYEDRKGTIWVGTGLVWDYNNDGGLNRFDRKTETFTRYLHNPTNPRTLINNKVRAIFEDSKGRFWIGTAGDGLHTMDRATGLFTRHRYDKSRPDQLARPPLKKGSINDHITFITEDLTGAMWIGTNEAGINHYDPATRRITHYSHLNKNSGFADNSGWWIYSSREGVMWISTNEANLYRVDPLRKKIPHFEVGEVVEAFHQDSAGSLYLGTQKGLIKVGRNKKIEKYFPFDSLHQTAGQGFLFVIREDSSANLWLACNNRLLTFNPRTQAIAQYNKSTARDSLADVFITTILEDRLGNFWIGGSPGLYLLDRQKGSLTIFNYSNSPTPRNSVYNNRIIGLLEDRLGDIWIARFYRGEVFRLRPKTRKSEHYIAGDNCCINCMYEDGQGTIWVGTSNGLFRFNKDSSAFALFTIPGHPINSAEIKAIVEDNLGNLLISTRSGIFKLNRNYTRIENYGEDHGVNASGLTHAAYKLQSGEILFGDATGYYAFFPEHLIKNSKPPEIVITDFQPDVSKSGPGTILKEPLTRIKQIRLKHNQNTITFRFVAFHYSKPSENRHQFMLEGHEETWRNGTDLTANYFNLPPGNYTFRVRAVTSAGIAAEKAIEIIIRPPWWETWWFRAIAIIFLGAVFYAFIRSRLHQKFRRQLEHFKKEKELAELRQKTSELEMQALRAQMNPHFIFNSLNSITVFIMENDKAKAAQYLTKFSRLVRLILQHSLSPLIPLESELEALRLYLDLEALRFNYHFEYTINVAESVNISAVKVPPLIIQPYVENAIWHGLMHKETKGKLQIKIFRQDNFLCCEITDDGIGRKNAAELKRSSTSTHESLGMRITADRIGLLQQKNQMHSFIRINDIVLPDGTAGGTEVLLKIPVLYD